MGAKASTPPMIGGSQLMNTPKPWWPRRSSIMPAMGKPRQAMSPTDQVIAGQIAPFMPSGPLPNMNPEMPINSAASARSTSVPRTSITFMCEDITTMARTRRPGSPPPFKIFGSTHPLFVCRRSHKVSHVESGAPTVNFQGWKTRFYPARRSSQKESGRESRRKNTRRWLVAAPGAKALVLSEPAKVRTMRAGRQADHAAGRMKAVDRLGNFGRGIDAAAFEATRSRRFGNAIGLRRGTATGRPECRVSACQWLIYRSPSVRDTPWIDT